MFPQVQVSKSIEQIVHFTVVCLVAKPLNRNEAKGDLVMIQTWLLFKYKLLCYHANQILVSIITRSPSASLQIRGLATKYTTAKWPIVSKQFSVLDRKAVAVQEMSPRPYPEISITVGNLAPRIWCETCEPVVSNNTQLHFKSTVLVSSGMYPL